MTRLLINLFFIIIICFSLSIMPINTEVLNLFSLESIFAPAEEEEEEVEKEAIADFTATYEIEYSLNNEERVYNPKIYTATLKTNIPESNILNYDFSDLKLNVYKNDELIQTFESFSFVTSSETLYESEVANVVYNLNLDYKHLGLETDGFYTLGFTFDSVEKETLGESKFNVAYRDDIKYITNGTAQNNGNFIYKAYFLNENKTNLVPLYFSVKYPESITVEVRNRLYMIPPVESGLSNKATIPAKTSISKLAKDHYGVFLNSEEVKKVISNNSEAELAILAIVQSLTRLSHISKLSFYLDNAQVEGSLYEVDLSKVYEASNLSKVYMTETNSTLNRYLLPIDLEESDIYDQVRTIFSILKTGEINGQTFTQIIPPEVNVNGFVIDGTTITVDFNNAFLSAYDTSDEYKNLMINSILYSLTSIENITKVLITVDEKPITTYGNIDFTEAVFEPPYINYIGEY